MAAHIVTAIDQIMDNPARELPHMQSALALDCWTADLTMDHYDKLCKAVENSTGALWQWALDHKDYYVKEWLDLNMPHTREEWHEAKYGGADE